MVYILDAINPATTITVNKDSLQAEMRVEVEASGNIFEDLSKRGSAKFDLHFTLVPSGQIGNN